MKKITFFTIFFAAKISSQNCSDLIKAGTVLTKLVYLCIETAQMKKICSGVHAAGYQIFPKTPFLISNKSLDNQTQKIMNVNDRGRKDTK